MNYRKELELFQRGVDTVRSLYGCHICVHDFSGQIVENVEELPVHHFNPFCVIFKRRGVDGERQCVLFDRGAVAARLSQKTEPFWKLCPCGIIEAVVPVFMDNRSIGVLFIGPFKTDSNQILPKGSLIAPSSSDLALVDKLGKNLPELSLADFSGILTFGELLSGQLEKILIKAATGKNIVKDRKQQIEDFFNENYHRNIALADLASRLCLSESRTFQLLKKYFGEGFSSLLLKKRLDRAEKLLRMSMFSIRRVSEMTGFQHSEYFCRVFKRKHKVSPREYRKLVAEADTDILS
jgi:AraC-like DNA-binding protein